MGQIMCISNMFLVILAHVPTLAQPTNVSGHLANFGPVVLDIFGLVCFFG